MNTVVKNDKFVNKYQSVVDNLQFLIIYTQLNISFVTEFLACWNHVSIKQYWETVKYTMRYLKDTLNYSILFDKFQKFYLVKYLNSDWKADLQDKKSITESLIKIADRSVFWHFTK